MTVPIVHRKSPGVPTIHYVEGPDAGPPLLLLHGVTRNWRDWEPLLTELTKSWRVIALDHRGHGGSGRTPGAYRVVDYARDAADFVNGSFSEPVTVLGHSLGAMVGLWLAAECASIVDRLVLEDPPFHTMGRRIADTPYQAQFAGMQDVILRGGDVAVMLAALADVRIPTPQGPMRLGDVRDRASLRSSAECLVTVDPAVLTPLAAGRWLDDFDYEPLWPRVRCPVLLLQADPTAGGTFTDADVDIARRGLSASHHLQFAGVGHQIHRSVPAKVLTALHEFAG